MDRRLPLRRLRELALAIASPPDPSEGDWTGPAFFVGVVDADEGGLTIAMRAVEPPDLHPSQVLPFFDVPDDWLALGLVAFGWARPLDERPDGSSRRRAHTVDLIDRRGAGVAVVHRQGDPVPIIVEHGPGELDAPVGLMADGLRRALGLPTPRCTASVLEYCARSWLAAVHDAAQLQPVATLSWPKVAALHPAMALLRRRSADRLVAAGLELVESVDWTKLRLAAAATSNATDEISGRLAGWMDDDMFGRALVSRLPELDDLLEQLDRDVSGPVHRHIDKALRAWGLQSGSDQAAC